MNTKQKQILARVLLGCGVIIAGVILGGITGKLVLAPLLSGEMSCSVQIKIVK